MRRLCFNNGFDFAKQLSFLLFAGLFLAACEAQVQPLSYYKANDDERRSVLADCADNPSKQMTDGNCVNAAAALDSLTKELRKEQKSVILRETDALRARLAAIHPYRDCAHLQGAEGGECRATKSDQGASLSESIAEIEKRIRDEYDKRIEAL